MNYQEALTKLGTRVSRKIANNTYMILHENEFGPSSVAIRLHNTNVVTFYQDGKVILNTGGWHTVTTKERINRFIPGGYTLSSLKGVWCVHHNGVAHEYEDGMDLMSL